MSDDCERPCIHVMQPRCVNCKIEQYALNVWYVSHGMGGCSWCGFVPPVYTDEGDYRAALKVTVSQEPVKEQE